MGIGDREVEDVFVGDVYDLDDATSPTKQRLFIQSLHQHPLFNGREEDICVIKLEKDIDMAS